MEKQTKQNTQQAGKRKHPKPSRIPNYNYKNLDEWLENSVKGIHIETDSPSSSALNIPAGFHLGAPTTMSPWRRDPWALPAELNYLNLPGYASPIHPLLHAHNNNNNNHHHYEFSSLPPILSAAATTTTTFGNGNDKATAVNDSVNQNRM